MRDNFVDEMSMFQISYMCYRKYDCKIYNLYLHSSIPVLWDEKVLSDPHIFYRISLNSLITRHIFSMQSLLEL